MKVVFGIARNLIDDPSPSYFQILRSIVCNWLRGWASDIVVCDGTGEGQLSGEKSWLRSIP